MAVDTSKEAQLLAGGWVGRLAEDRPSGHCKTPYLEISQARYKRSLL